RRRIAARRETVLVGDVQREHRVRLAIQAVDHADRNVQRTGLRADADLRGEAVDAVARDRVAVLAVVEERLARQAADGAEVGADVDAGAGRILARLHDDREQRIARGADVVRRAEREPGRVGRGQYVDVDRAGGR